MVTWTTDVNMESSGSTEHRELHGPWPQHGPQTLSWPSVVDRPWASTWSTDINMASGVSMDHGHPHGLLWRHGPQTSTWPLSQQDMASGF